MADATTLIRVSRATHEKLRRLSEAESSPITAIVELAVKDLERKRFWERFHRACEAVRADPEASAALDAEDAAWEVTLADGLAEET